MPNTTISKTPLIFPDGSILLISYENKENVVYGQSRIYVSSSDIFVRFHKFFVVKDPFKKKVHDFLHLEA